jgi:dTDP-4-amino-4,6-dideoxygalactose transaminase
MRVPFYDHAAEYWSIKPEIDSAIARVLNSGVYTDGQEVRAFEEEFAEYCGAKHAITAGSGYDALFKALLALEVRPGDEIITVANTDIACPASISHAGASVIWVDIDERTYNIDPRKIKESITSRTKAIMVVHMYGHPADMDPIMEVARSHGLFVVEDAAIAVGARYKGNRVGAIGDVGCFSHAPSKIMGNYGDGGTIVTNDSDLAEKIRELFIYSGVPSPLGNCINVSGQGILSGFWFTNEGYHGRMVELSVAVLRVKLKKKLDEWISTRREIAARYNELLINLDVVLPFESEDVEHVYRNYTIRVRNRDKVRYKLAEKGVGTGIHYVPPLHLQPVYKHLGYYEGSLPVTEAVSTELFTLPIYPELSREQLDWVALALEESIREVNRL